MSAGEQGLNTSLGGMVRLADAFYRWLLEYLGVQKVQGQNGLCTWVCNRELWQELQSNIGDRGR